MSKTLKILLCVNDDGIMVKTIKTLSVIKALRKALFLLEISMIQKLYLKK